MQEPTTRPAPAFLDVPPTSLLLAVAGGALLVSRHRLPRVARGTATLGGLALIGAAAFRPAAALLRTAGTRRRAVEFRMSFLVDQPVERVFAFCRDFENFPRFIGALRSVQDYGDGRSRWCASTPAGGTLQWDAITTKYVPNRVLAWQTVPGSRVEAMGLMRFRREESRTCLEVVLSYRPPEDAGLRDALAALVAPSRERQLHHDLANMVQYLCTAPAAELTALRA